jgi:hypothetical protein
VQPAATWRQLSISPAAHCRVIMPASSLMQQVLVLMVVLEVGRCTAMLQHPCMQPR